MICLTIFILSIIVGEPNTDLKPFNELFILSDRLILPEEVVIGGISSFDSNGQDFVFSDHISNTIYLYRGELRAFAKLEQDTCHPGFITRPISITFNEQGILLTNSHIQAYQFNLDGTCKGLPNDRFTAPFFITGFIEGYVGLTWKPWSNEIVYILEYDENLNITNETSFNGLKNPNLSVKMEGGGIVSNDSLIYFSTSASSQIYVFDSHSKTIIPYLKSKSPKYKEPSKDIRETDSVSDLFSEIKNLGSHSQTSGLSILNDSLFVQSFYNGFEDIHYVSLLSNQLDTSYTVALPKGYTFLGVGNQNIYFLSLTEHEDGHFKYSINLYKLD